VWRGPSPRAGEAPQPAEEPREDARESGGPGVAPGTTAGHPTGEPEPEDVAPPRAGHESGASLAPEAVGYLPEIIRTFAVTDRTDPILQRLSTLLDTLHRWLDLGGAVFEVVEDAIEQAAAPSERVEVVTEEVLRANPVYAEAIESGAPRLVRRGEAPVNGSHPSEPWDVVGIAPVFGMGRVYGVLRMYFHDSDRDTMFSQLNVATGVLRQMIDFRVQIADLTSVDALTGIYNRHFFDLQLPVEVERAMRAGGEVALLLLDIDDFKAINDEIGHKKGDEALCTVAEIIRRNLRKVDIPFRYGGEEIVILLPGTSRFESVHTAERLRRRISEHEGFLDLHGRPRRITVSVGVSVYPETARTGDDLFEQADAAMYRAKHLGKNRVVLYSDDMAAGPDGG
jgi:diguanylate cyclase (GGDEF)-like protein